MRPGSNGPMPRLDDPRIVRRSSSSATGAMAAAHVDIALGSTASRNVCRRASVDVASRRQSGRDAVARDCRMRRRIVEQCRAAATLQPMAVPIDSLRPLVSSPRSVHAARHLQRRRIRAEPADRRFPHAVGGRVEDQIAIDVADQPRRGLELRFELPGPPAGVADDQARARRRLRARAAAAAGRATSTDTSPSAIRTPRRLRPRPRRRRPESSCAAARPARRPRPAARARSTTGRGSAAPIRRGPRRRPDRWSRAAGSRPGRTRPRRCACTAARRSG